MEMATKMAAMVTSTQDKDLRNFVREAYGLRSQIGPKTLDLKKAVGTETPSATTMSGHHWLFDWSRIEDWLMSSFGRSGTQVAYAIHEDLQFYGFAVHHNGQVVRRRVGNRAEGIIADFGAMLDFEFETITNRFGEKHLNEGLYIWHDERVKGFSDHHYSLGRSIVVDLLKLQTGVNLNSSHASTFHRRKAKVIMVHSKTLLQGAAGA